jgi:hypothetical protein
VVDGYDLGGRSTIYIDPAAAAAAAAAAAIRSARPDSFSLYDLTRYPKGPQPSIVGTCQGGRARAPEATTDDHGVRSRRKDNPYAVQV